MTDARFPERWLNDRRVLRLSDRALRLYVLALLFSVSNRTDGVLYDDDLALIATVDPSVAAELEKAGLWRRERDYWVVTDFAETQTSADDLAALEGIRHTAREKKRRQRAAAAAESSGLSRGLVPGTAQDRTGQARTGNKEKPTTDVAHASARAPLPDWAGDGYDREP